MKSKSYLLKFSLSLFVLSFMSINLFSAIKGSEANLSVEPFYTFLSDDTDNKMLGFGWFKNGFGLEDSTTSCTFDSIFPVSGDIYLNGGYLNLSSDLLFRNMTSWVSPGTIYGNNYLVDLSSSITGLGSSLCDQVFSDAIININSDLVISGTVKFQGDCLFNGNGKRILLAEDGYILVDVDSTVTFKHIYLDGITDGKICCLGDTSKIVLDDIRLILDGDYSFTKGSLKIFNEVDCVGSHTFFYQSSQTSTIDTHSFFNLSQGVKLSIGRAEAGGEEPFYFADETSVLNLENCCLSISESGMRITRGTLIVDRGVEIEINSTDSTNGFALGDGTDVGDMVFLFHPGARVNFSKGHLSLNNTDPRSLRSRSGEALFVRGSESVFYVNDDIQLEGIALDTHPSSQLFIKDGKILTYVGCRVLYPGVEFELGGSRYNNYTNLMNGDGDIFLIKGMLSPYTYVQGLNNILHGNGDISGKVILHNCDTELTINLNGVFANDIELNGGTVTLGHDLGLTQDSIFSGSGTIDLSGYTLNFGVNDLVLSDSIHWQSNSGCLQLNSKVELLGTWTFNGACTLNGNNNVLILGQSGQIIVNPNSCLKLKNIRIEGITDGAIFCLDNSSKIIFDRVEWIQEGNYSFTNGSMMFCRNVVFDGDYTFSYESSQTSTIDSNSLWVLDSGMTLWIGRHEGVDGIEPLYLEDTTSFLELDDSCLHVTSSGMRLTNGTLLVGREVQIESDGTSSVDALVLGDGTTENDLSVGFRSGATARFNSGTLVSELATPYGFWIRHGFARLVREPESIFYLNTDTILSNMKLEDKSALEAVIIKDGVSLAYNNCTVKLAGGVSYDITAKRYNYYTNLLNGDEEIFISKGTLPSYTLVMGTGNLIRGNGDITGGIIVQGPGAELSLNLQGMVANDITLNDGKLICLGDVNLLHDSVIKGQGEIDLSTNSFYTGIKDLSWTSTIYWDGDGGELEMNSKIFLSGKWTFSGTCVLKGNGNILILKPEADLVIEKGSTLILRDVKLKNLSGTKLRCLDENGVIKFDESKARLDADYTFTQGKIEVNEFFELHGSYTFDYQSNQKSIVGPCSEFKMMEGGTFKYNPQVPIRDLFCLKYALGSKFVLDNSSLYSTATGMQLTKGTLEAYGVCSLISEATCEEEGITFGDGISEANDLDVDIMPNANLELQSGYVVDKNVGVV